MAPIGGGHFAALTATTASSSIYHSRSQPHAAAGALQHDWATSSFLAAPATYHQPHLQQQPQSQQSYFTTGSSPPNTADQFATANWLELLEEAKVANDSYPYNYNTYNNNNIHLGPQRDSLKIVIPVTIIYTLIFISGVIGNISTCIVIKKNRSMHTATNYYLFSLAISDFLLLLSGVPQEMYFIWSKYSYVLGEYFCIGRGMLAETSANATVLTITAFTVERYVAICHPFLGQAMSKLSRAIRIIILIWLVSVVTAVPQAAQFGIVSHGGAERCAVVRHIIQHSFQLSTYIFFFAPMTIILVLYLLIGLRLYRSSLIGGGADGGSGGGGGSGRDRGNGRGRFVGSPFGSGNLTRSSGSKGSRLGMKGTQSDTTLYHYSGGNQISAVRGRLNHYGTRRVLKMLVAVVICFFLCWAPFHAQRLIAIYGSKGLVGGADGDVDGDSVAVVADGSEHIDTGGDITAADEKHEEVIYTVATYVSGVLYYLSTCINPLLYNIMSNKFRQAFKAILFRKKPVGSTTSRRAQQSQRLRRNPTLTSSTQRDSSDSELQSKHSMLQVNFTDFPGNAERAQSRQPTATITEERELTSDWRNYKAN